MVTNYELDDFEVESILSTIEVIGKIPFFNTFLKKIATCFLKIMNNNAIFFHIWALRFNIFFINPYYEFIVTCAIIVHDHDFFFIHLSTSFICFFNSMFICLILLQIHSATLVALSSQVWSCTYHTLSRYNRYVHFRFSIICLLFHNHVLICFARWFLLYVYCFTSMFCYIIQDEVFPFQFKNCHNLMMIFPKF